MCRPPDDRFVPAFRSRTPGRGISYAARTSRLAIWRPEEYATAMADFSDLCSRFAPARPVFYRQRQFPASSLLLRSNRLIATCCIQPGTRQRLTYETAAPTRAALHTLERT